MTYDDIWWCIMNITLWIMLYWTLRISLISNIFLILTMLNFSFKNKNKNKNFTILEREKKYANGC